MLLGIVTEVRFVQSEKMLSFILVSPSGRTIDSKAVHRLKAYVPMLVRVHCNSIEDKLVQSKKADSPMDVTLLGTVIEDKFEQFWKV